jgi:hypothetical protein
VKIQRAIVRENKPILVVMEVFATRKNLSTLLMLHLPFELKFIVRKSDVALKILMPNTVPGLLMEKK